MATVRDQTNLVRRAGSDVYQFRIAIPADLRGQFHGKREVRRSLRTKDKGEARRRAAMEKVKVLEHFERVRKSLNPEHRDTLTAAEVKHLIAAWTAEQLARDERLRALGEIDLDAVEEQLSEGNDVLRDALPAGNVGPIAFEVNRVLRENGLFLSPGSLAWRQFGYAMLQAAAKLHGAISVRQSGGVVDTPGSPGPLRRKTDSLMALVAYWKSQAARQPKTAKAVEAAAKAFSGLHPELASARQIERRHIIAFRDRLLEDGKAPKTVGKTLALLSAVLQIAVDGERLPANPASGVKVSMPKAPQKPRVPFAPADLQKITAALPTDDPPMRWVPLLALFTGARLAELTQVRTEDVREEGGIPFIQITPEAGPLKTAGSDRRIPIHVKLIAHGFLAYVEERRQTGDLRLFPGLKSDPLGKRFGRFLRKSAKVTDKRKTFHSFRHLFKDACREAGISQELHDQLTGHRTPGVGATYGLGVSLKTLAEAVAKLSFPLP